VNPTKSEVVRKLITNDQINTHGKNRQPGRHQKTAKGKRNGDTNRKDATVPEANLDAGRQVFATPLMWGPLGLDVTVNKHQGFVRSKYGFKRTSTNEGGGRPQK